MWLFTRYGFYSVVQDKKDGKLVQIRARIKEDLERLATFAGKELGMKMLPIISTPHADYAYRVVVERKAWAKVATAMAEDIDYENFKNEVHGEEDRDDAYLDCWCAMHELQQNRKKV